MSDLGSLSECLVDNDPAARVRARRLRGKALVLSVAFEAVILTAMLIWPLISPGVLIARYIVTPTPPYSGGGAAHHEQNAIHRPHVSPFPTICLAVCAPVIHPSAPSSDSEAPEVNQSDTNSNGAGVGPFMSGTIIPGGGGTVAAPEPPRATSRGTDAHERRRNGGAAGSPRRARISRDCASGPHFRRGTSAQSSGKMVRCANCR